MKKYTVLIAIVLATVSLVAPVMAEGGHDHGHGHSHEALQGGDDDHGDHEESQTRITPESAKNMGVNVAQAGPVTISSTIPLAGRIVLNENRRANVRARFSGIVRAVKVNLGDTVQKGQVMAVVEANESLKTYDVTAPIAGVVLERNTNTGDVANDGALFMIADLSDVWAKFHVFPRDAQFVHVGQDVTVHTIDRNVSAQGEIGMFFPLADETSQTQMAIVPLSNPDRAWKPGMAVEANVNVASETVAVGVREAALQTMEELGDVVFVEENGTYTPQPVKTGRKGGGYIEILSGLSAGTAYVAEGSFVIKSDILKSTATHAH